MQPETIRLLITVLSYLTILIFNVLALFRMWNKQRTEQEKLRVYVETKFIEVSANYERVDKEMKLHQALNERQFEKYHQETREDFARLDKKLDSIQGYLMNKK